MKSHHWHSTLRGGAPRGAEPSPFWIGFVFVESVEIVVFEDFGVCRAGPFGRRSKSAVPTLPTAACCRGGPWAQGQGGQYRWPRACRAVPHGVCRSQRGETSSDPAWTLVDRRVLLDQGSSTPISRSVESVRNLVVHVPVACSFR